MRPLNLAAHSFPDVRLLRDDRREKPHTDNREFFAVGALAGSRLGAPDRALGRRKRVSAASGRASSPGPITK